jgi:hypothetical protein
MAPELRALRAATPAMIEAFRALGYRTAPGAFREALFASGAGRAFVVSLTSYHGAPGLVRLTLSGGRPPVIEVTALAEELALLVPWLPRAAAALDLGPLPVREHAASTWGPEYRWTAAAHQAYTAARAAGGAS